MDVRGGGAGPLAGAGTDAALPLPGRGEVPGGDGVLQ